MPVTITARPLRALRSAVAPATGGARSRGTPCAPGEHRQHIQFIQRLSVGRARHTCQRAWAATLVTASASMAEQTLEFVTELLERIPLPLQSLIHLLAESRLGECLEIRSDLQVPEVPRES